VIQGIDNKSTPRKVVVSSILQRKYGIGRRGMMLMMVRNIALKEIRLVGLQTPRAIVEGGQKARHLAVYADKLKRPALD
jgi:hypothetical protein